MNEIKSSFGYYVMEGIHYCIGVLNRRKNTIKSRQIVSNTHKDSQLMLLFHLQSGRHGLEIVVKCGQTDCLPAKSPQKANKGTLKLVNLNSCFTRQIC